MTAAAADKKPSLTFPNGRTIFCQDDIIPADVASINALRRKDLKAAYRLAFDNLPVYLPDTTSKRPKLKIQAMLP